MPEVSIDTIKANLDADLRWRERRHPKIAESLRKQWASGKRQGHEISPEHRAKMLAGIRTARAAGVYSKSNKQSWQTRISKGNAVSGATGKHWHLSSEERRRRSLSRRGENASNWKGGKTAAWKLARKSVDWKLWREAVFTRDNYTCQLCHARGVELHPDHIKPFAFFPELRYHVSNGRTLCAECHRKTPTYGSGAAKCALTNA